jgi:N-acetylneuraminic acid mutarotase
MPYSIRRVSVSFWVLLLGMCFFVSAIHAQRYVKGPVFPDPSEEVYGVAAGGKMYVLGGLAPAWKPKGFVYEYDPAIQQWNKKKSMALASHHVALVEMNGKIYVFGGFNLPESGPPAWVPLNNAWEYDPVADSWKALAPLPTKRGSPVAVASGGKIYVIGGASVHPGSSATAIRPDLPHRSLGTVEEYDPKTNTWRERSSMPTPRNHAAVGEVNGKIYVIGGRLGAAFIGVASNTDLVEEYNPSTDQWGTARARMITPRSAAAWGVYNGRIYVAGGEFQNSQLMAAFRAVEAYEPATNTWSALPQMPVPRHGLAGGMIGSHLHLVSGTIQSSGIVGMHIDSDSNDILELEAK